jgi:hypothetical protein
MEICGNLLKLYAIDWLTPMGNDDNILFSWKFVGNYQDPSVKDEMKVYIQDCAKFHIQNRIQVALGKAEECRKSGENFDCRSWLDGEAQDSAYRALQLETLREELVKRFRASGATKAEKDKLLRDYHTF